MRITPLLMALALGTFVAGCVIIPYRPNAETTTGLAAINNPERLLLSIEPRKLLKDMTKAVSKADKRLQFVDGRAVIDIAAPADRNVAWLMSPSTRELIAPLKLDYLVLLAEPTERTLKEDDDYLLAMTVPIPVAAGFYKEKHSTAYWSAVLDASTLQLAGQLTSEAVGTDRQFALMYALILVSDTKGAARKAVVRHIVDTIAAARPAGPVRVALLAVVPISKFEKDPEAESWESASPP